MRPDERGSMYTMRAGVILLLVSLAFVSGCSGDGDSGSTSQNPNPNTPPACLVNGTASVTISNDSQNVAIRMIYNGAIPSTGGNQFIALPGQKSASFDGVVAGQFFTISAQRVDNNVLLATYSNQTLAPCDSGDFGF